MFNKHKCPICEGTATERVHTERFQYLIDDTYICNECPNQYTIQYGDPAKHVDMVVDE